MSDSDIGEVRENIERLERELGFVDADGQPLRRRREFKENGGAVLLSKKNVVGFGPEMYFPTSSCRIPELYD